MKTLASSAELEAIRNRIALASPTDEHLWGSMSVHQMLCHLTDAFRGALAEFAVRPFNPIPLPRPVFKYIGLYVPMQWPHGVPMPPEIRQHPACVPAAGFEADRNLLLAKLKAFVGTEKLAPVHPMWGRLTRTEWMRWGYLHCDHHLRQFGR